MRSPEGSPVAGRADSALASAAHAQMRHKVARVLWEAQRSREQTLRITARIAETERQLAATLHALAAGARREGRAEDAERLDGYAGAAERFAALERRRVADG